MILAEVLKKLNIKWPWPHQYGVVCHPKASTWYISLAYLLEKSLGRTSPFLFSGCCRWSITLNQSNVSWFHAESHHNESVSRRVPTYQDSSAASSQRNDWMCQVAKEKEVNIWWERWFVGLSNWLVVSRFDRKLKNSRFCASAVKVWTTLRKMFQSWKLQLCYMKSTPPKYRISNRGQIYSISARAYPQNCQ